MNIITRKALVGFCLLLLSGAVSAFGFVKKGGKPDSLSCLLIGGRFAVTAEKIKDIRVYLLLNNQKVDSAVVNGDKDFAFVLKRNNFYCIQMCKDGYVTRNITINTTLPNSVSAAPLFIFEFTTEMKKELEGADDYYFDFPIATVSYNTLIDKFDYSRKYTTHIKTKMKQTENEFKLTKSH